MLQLTQNMGCAGSWAVRGLEALCLCLLLGGCLTEHQFDPEGSLGKQQAQVSLYLEHEGASPDLSVPTGGPVQTEYLQCPLRWVWEAQGQSQPCGIRVELG